MKNTTIFTHPIIVVARIDGRGGVEPFGTYGKNQAGAKVQIGNKQYTVTKDGRVNIPKSVMKTGIKGSDGRYRIAIGFSSAHGKTGWKNVSAVIVKPTTLDISGKKGDRLKFFEPDRDDDLVPRDVKDYNWSAS